MNILKNSSGKYDTAEIQFSLPIDDSSVKSNDFFFLGTGWNFPGGSGHSFSTNVTSVQQANDEYITITFNAKDSVSSVSYSKGSLKGLNSVDVESQDVTPILQP